MKKNINRKIVFIYIPRFFLESERLRRKWAEDALCVIASGEAKTSMIIDISGSLSGMNIRRGMLLKDIRHLKSDINVIIVDYEYIKEMNDTVIAYLKDYSAVIESSNFGEFYIDLTGTERLFGRTIDTCGRIISGLKERYGFECRAGIAGNKLISYIASKMTEGASVYEIYRHAENIFLSPARISYLPDIPAEVKSEISSAYNIQTMRELSAFSPSDLNAMFRKHGSLLYSYSRNIAPDFLSAKAEAGTLGKILVLSDTANDDAIIRRKFFHLVSELCVLMRKGNIFPLYFDLKVIYKDEYKYAKSKKIDTPTFIDRTLYALLLPHLDAALTRRTSIKKIILTFFRFIPAVIQETLFFNDNKDLKLCRAFDSIREKYGTRGIYFPE